MANTGKLKVRVDRDKCQGHNRCKALAPELFELDEYGNARAKGDGTVPAGLEEKAYLAKSNCHFSGLTCTLSVLELATLASSLLFPGRSAHLALRGP